MPEVLANHHDAAVATNHLALVTDLLDARFDLHCCPSMERLLVAVDDAAAGEVVRAELDDDPVTGQDADVVHAHLAADMSEHLVTVRQLDPEHGVRERLDDLALDLDGPVFLRHILRVPSTWSALVGMFFSDNWARARPALLVKSRIDTRTDCEVYARSPANAKPALTLPADCRYGACQADRAVQPDRQEQDRQPGCATGSASAGTAAVRPAGGGRSVVRSASWARVFDASATSTRSWNSSAVNRP